jgi:antitoxin MazE
MLHMRSAIRRLGNSQGVSIPKSILDEAGLKIDSPIEITVDGTSIVLRKIPVHPREGWAEAAALVTYTDEDREWLEADLDPEARAGNKW